MPDPSSQTSGGRASRKRRQICLNPQKMEPPDTFAARLAHLLWASKASQHLAYHAGVDERTCHRWFSGESSPSHRAWLAMLEEVMRQAREDGLENGATS